MKQILAALLLAGCAPAPTPPPTATAPPPPSKPGQSAFETTCAVPSPGRRHGPARHLPADWPAPSGPSEIWKSLSPSCCAAPRGHLPPQALKDDQIAEILTYVRSSGETPPRPSLPPRWPPCANASAPAIPGASRTCARPSRTRRENPERPRPTAPSELLISAHSRSRRTCFCSGVSFCGRRCGRVLDCGGPGAPACSRLITSC